MTRNTILPIALVLAAGAGIYCWTHRAQKPETDASDDAVPTIVTVQVGHLRRATLHGYVNGYGLIQPAPASGSEPAAASRVAPAVAGVVKRVLVTEGMQVAAGAPLVELEDAAARVAVETARETAARQRALYAENNTSLKSVQDAEAGLATAQAQLALLHVTAPLAGTVTHVNARPGEAVDLTSVLAEITDLHRLAISIDVPSAAVGAIQPGQRVELPGTTAQATAVSYVSPAVDPATDTVNVRAPAPSGAGLRPGALVPVRIITVEHADCLAAPAESVVTNADDQPVISVVHNDEAAQVPVNVGLRDAGLVEITAGGLQPGDTVVTTGAYGLPEKTKIEVAKAVASAAP